MQVSKRGGKVLLKFAEAPRESACPCDENVIMSFPCRSRQHSGCQCTQTPLGPVPHHRSTQTPGRGETYSRHSVLRSLDRRTARLDRKTRQHLTTAFLRPQKIGASFQGNERQSWGLGPNLRSCVRRKACDGHEPGAVIEPGVPSSWPCAYGSRDGAYERVGSAGRCASRQISGLHDNPAQGEPSFYGANFDVSTGAAGQCRSRDSRHARASVAGRETICLRSGR